MTNKQVASWGMLSFIILLLALLSGGDTQEADGIIKLVYYAGSLGFWVFVIWGWVKSFK